MLPKKNRLKKGHYAILKQGLKVKSKYFIIFHKESNNKDPRFAIVATKKLGKAVVRNYIRRIVKSMLREYLGEIKKFDYVIIPSKFVGDWKKLEFQEIKEDLIKNLKSL